MLRRSFRHSISVIIPVYNESSHIRSSLTTIEEQLKLSKEPYEIILVDDGSKDDTFRILSEEMGHIENLKIIKLSRNFGKEAAIMAGLEKCSGKAAIIMDSDMQHPPHLIPKMVEMWKQGYDVVECVKTSRNREGLGYRFCAKAFYSIIKRLSELNLEGASDFKLIDKKVIDSIRSMREKNLFFRGMSKWVGFQTAQIPFTVEDRVDGKSKWSLKSLISLGITGITSFSSAPLHIITFFGNVFIVGAVILFIQTLIHKFTGKAVDGFTTVILLLLVIGGLLLLSLGIIGIYIAKIYDETKARPRYIVEEIREHHSNTQLIRNV